MEQGTKAAELRQRAEDKFAKAKRRDEEVMDSQRRRQEVEEAKLLRLRSLRLAKEAADREHLKAEAEAALSARGGKACRSKRRKGATFEQKAS